MKNEVIGLVSKTYEQNDYGVSVETEVVNNVLAYVKSARSSEWFEGGRSGLNPIYVFTIARIEYNEEQAVDYNGVRYAVYRTYIKLDEIELHVQKEKGA